MVKKIITKIVSKFSKFSKTKFPNKGKGKMAIVDIANVMAQIEGWNVTGSLAQRNNNPLNLRFANQPGAVLGEAGFAKFSTPEAGFQAGENQIQLDASRGLDVSGFLNKFAPSSENNTSQYINMFTSMLGVSASDKLSSLIDSGGVVDAATSTSGNSEVGSIDPTMIGVISLVGLGVVVIVGMK